LRLVVGITRLYPATLLAGLGVATMQVIWIVMWTVLVVNALTRGRTVSNIELILLVLSMIWTTQVLVNLVHVTVAGTVSTWYFMHETGMPLNPTLRSFIRASTSSFGSVCLGSLFVSILRTARFLVLSARRSNISPLIMLASLVMRVLDRMIVYFNMYAFTQVAIYSKPFFKAGKDTWELIQARGVDGLINIEVVSSALTAMNLTVGTFTAICGALWAQQQHDDINVLVVSGICFAAGYTITLIVTSSIESGVAAVFVCYAEDPEILSRADPVTFSQIREACAVDSGHDQC